ncbi:hypothetical protein [Vibrio sp. VB16]|uniref:hypothetical protein n=1 Tax=Vibrio sp. VB16 TaxID=2785746 RepID=UPI00189F158F|nr:hypothetical protein [Vibrio sp. VB16]UGA55302.1 hypothetical protein IUZ65_002820 [Vibrio sp. VB16]
MKTNLVFASDRDAVIRVDIELMAFLNKRTSTDCGGHSMRFAILDRPWKTPRDPEPYRVIEVEGMHSGIAITEKLDSLGFICINKKDNYPTKGFDMIYVYPLSKS